jgi:hypothetical protein
MVAGASLPGDPDNGIGQPKNKLINIYIIFFCFPYKTYDTALTALLYIFLLSFRDRHRP